MSRVRLLTIAATVCAAFAGAVAITPVAVAAEPPVVVDFAPEQRAAALGHWTPERMRDAAQDQSGGDTGPLTHEWQGTPLPTVGKVFFTKPDTGADSYCTATSVGGEHGDTVVTAAHCLTRPGTTMGEYQDLVFAPGWSDGVAPFGVFPVRASVFPHEFTGTDQLGHDVGVLKVDPVGNRSLRDVVGAETVDLSGTSGVDAMIFGYPMSRPQNGQRQLYCQSPAPLSPTEGNLRANCDMVGGASGGPWFSDFGTPEARKLVSVSSGGTAHLDGAVFGPNAKVVFDAAADK